MTDDLELRKRIAAQAQADSATAASAGVRAFQFFMVPLLIVGACVGIFLLVRYVTVNPRSPREWIQDIKSGGRNVRAHATLQLAQALRRMDRPDKSLTPDILEVYRTTGEGSEEDKVRRFLAMCLGFLADSRASSLLMEEARTRDHLETKAACLDALGNIKDPATVPFLVKLLDASDPVVRKYAAFNAGAAAEETRDPGVVEALRKKLSDPVPDVTWNAAFALAYFLDDPSGTDILMRMLDREYLTRAIGADPNADVLIARALFTACNGAVKLGDKRFIPALRKLTDLDDEPDMDIRNAARKAISSIEGE